jgi:hypothetical protein
LRQDSQDDDLGGRWAHAEEHGERIAAEQGSMDRVMYDREAKRHGLNRVKNGFELREERTAS